MANENNELLAEHVEFNEKMENAATEEEAAALLKEYGMDSFAYAAFDEELSEEQLAQVAGGQKYQVKGAGIPVFDSLPRVWPFKQRIIATQNKGHTFTASRIYCNRTKTWWVKTERGYINMMHVLRID